jgi:hypothetical protein
VLFGGTNHVAQGEMIVGKGGPVSTLSGSEGNRDGGYIEERVRVKAA